MTHRRGKMGTMAAVAVALCWGRGCDGEGGPVHVGPLDGGPGDAGPGEVGPADAGIDAAADAAPCLDHDGDGAGPSGPCPFDCDDVDPTRPGPEVCDGVDQDCDGEIDEGCAGNCAGVDVCDPDCGFVGRPCRNNQQCELDAEDGGRLAFTCLDEPTYGLPGGYCAAIPSLADVHACDPEDDASCPAAERGRCVRDEYNDYGSCLRSCELSDENWDETNCGCRQGYECDLSGAYCTRGCSVERQDEDCCTRFDEVQDAFVAIEDCSSVCDPQTFRCTNPGAEGAAVGDECLHGLDCTANGTCFGLDRPRQGGCFQGCWEPPPSAWRGGYCTLVSCELDGRQCPGQASCIHVAGSTPRTLCMKTCTVADRAIIDPFAEPNPACREGYRCLAVPELAGAPSCVDDVDCPDGVACVGGLCGGDGVCIPVPAPRLPATVACDTTLYAGTGCPGDDPATTLWNETQRCEDGICQPPCDEGHGCDIDGDGASDTTCVEGYCQVSAIGGPCFDDGAWRASDLACALPYGQGRCLQGGAWSDRGACVLESCGAAGMEEYCGEGLRCVGPGLLPPRAYPGHRVEAEFGSVPSLPWVEFTTAALCLDACTVAADDCAGADECQGEAVGCRSGFSCVNLGDGADEGVCLASCSESGDPDQFCESTFDLGHCALDRGVCEP